jgi:hypothetical protein
MDHVDWYITSIHELVLMGVRLGATPLTFFKTGECVLLSLLTSVRVQSFIRMIIALLHHLLCVLLYKIYFVLARWLKFDDSDVGLVSLNKPLIIEVFYVMSSFSSQDLLSSSTLHRSYYVSSNWMYAASIQCIGRPEWSPISAFGHQTSYHDILIRPARATRDQRKQAIGSYTPSAL